MSCMLEVDKTTPEYVDAVKEFEESMTSRNVNFSIERVERVESKAEYSKHMALQDAIRVKHKKEPKVRRLFHGSRQDKLHLIAVQGFNRIFAADTNGKSQFACNAYNYDDFTDFPCSCFLWQRCLFCSGGSLLCPG